jgi:ankyrin repeat protein
LNEEYLKEQKKLMNVIGSDGWNAMHFACYLGHSDIVEHFINKKANVNKLSLEGYSPL